MSDDEHQEEKQPLSYRARRFIRSIRFPISLVVLIVGAFLGITAFAAYSPLIVDQPFSSYVPQLMGADCPAAYTPPCPASPTGTDWTLLFIVLGAILIIAGLYLTVSYVLARQRFEHLMKTKSKAEFVRNLPEAEDLLWDLLPKDEIRLAQKKQELRVRE
jgi:hypothetical protein